MSATVGLDKDFKELIGTGPSGRPTMEPLTTSEKIDSIAGALAAAQAEVDGASKDAVNPHFRSKYADLASVWEACRACLTKNGLAVTQVPSGEGKVVRLTTLLVHKSGQWIGGTSTMTSQQDTPQAIGSCLTYLRRYTLAALVGVAPEDDDGNAASSRHDDAGKGAPVQRATDGRRGDQNDYDRSRMESAMAEEPRISKSTSKALHDDGTVEVVDGKTGVVSRQPRITADQLTEIAELASRGGYTKPQVLKLVKDTFRVDDVMALGRGQAIDLVRRLSRKADAATTAMGAVAGFATPTDT